MATTTPVPATVAPGQFITGALWNAQVGAANAWHFGTGSDGPPRFMAHQTTAQSITGGTNYVSILLDTEDFDSHGGHSTTTNTSRYTAQVSGLYLCMASVAYPAASTGNRSLQISVNGATARGSEIIVPAFASNSNALNTQTMVYLNVGDYVEAQTWQTTTTSPTTVAISTGIADNNLAVLWMSN